MCPRCQFPLIVVILSVPSHVICQVAFPDECMYFVSFVSVVTMEVTPWLGVGVRLWFYVHGWPLDEIPKFAYFSVQCSWLMSNPHVSYFGGKFRSFLQSVRPLSELTPKLSRQS